MVHYRYAPVLCQRGGLSCSFSSSTYMGHIVNYLKIDVGVVILLRVGVGLGVGTGLDVGVG